MVGGCISPPTRGIPNSLWSCRSRASSKTRFDGQVKQAGPLKLETYYKISVGRMTFGELVRHAPNATTAVIVRIFSATRFFQVRDQTLHRFPRFRELVVSEHELSAAAQTAINPPVLAFKALGF